MAAIPSEARFTIGPVSTAAERRERLKAVYEDARGCVRCPLHQTRTQVVFGAGNANADLMFIGEAPGANEDRLGLPFVGQAGKLLDKLLGEIGMAREPITRTSSFPCSREMPVVSLRSSFVEKFPSVQIAVGSIRSTCRRR